MFLSKKPYIVLIIIGSIVAIYAQAEEKQNTTILVVGIVLLMFGLYKLAASIPSKKNKDDEGSI